MTHDPHYTIVIGLEVHVQLKTVTKLFCGCSTQFGAPPNSQVCPVCLGLPGALPVLNRRAVELALTTAAALHCDVPPSTKWDRKNYFYPDLPKGYQISQYDLPLARDGFLDVEDPKGQRPATRVRILRAHLEEDAGKSMHDELAGRAASRIDLNRTGTPLLEIVTQPDLRSPLDAKAFLTELKLLLSYLDVSDCNMQEGSLRVDANINLHIPHDGTTVATPIVEIKNVNSFRAAERALAYEAVRQFDEWQATGKTLGAVPKQTRGWDDQAEVTRGQRHKEESSDYRYFPDPDLVPLAIGPAWLDKVRAELGELPAALRQRLRQTYQLEAYDAEVLVQQGPGVVRYFEAAARAAGDGRRASNWVQQEVLRAMNERPATIETFPIGPADLGQLLAAVAAGELDTTRAKEVFQHMLTAGVSLDAARLALGIERVETDALIDLCRGLLTEFPRVAQDVRGGKQQAIGALVGQARKRNPNANPAEVRKILLELLAEP